MRGRACPVEVIGHDRPIDSKQPAARFGVVAGGLLPVGGDGADALGDYGTVLQLVVLHQPPDLGQPGVDKRTVVVSGPGVQQRDAFEADQIRKRVLINHQG